MFDLYIDLNSFIDLCHVYIQEKETLYNNENINPTLIWELIKSDIRGYAIKYSSEVKKQETEVIKDRSGWGQRAI